MASGEAATEAATIAFKVSHDASAEAFGGENFDSGLEAAASAATCAGYAAYLVESETLPHRAGGLVSAAGSAIAALRRHEVAVASSAAATWSDEPDDPDEARRRAAAALIVAEWVRSVVPAFPW